MIGFIGLVAVATVLIAIGMAAAIVVAVEVFGLPSFIDLFVA